MQTRHKIHLSDARRLSMLSDASVELVVTSPPYPMIEMWDEVFASQDASVGEALESADGARAFESMHALLDAVWSEVARVLAPGGIACINIGDATRTLGGSFALYPNHARILSASARLGLTPLPIILWRKQTNAPNKFMGSGMLPPGAYVTLEHEYVLIVRKGGKREFTDDDSRALRRRSAYFWEERNRWFSDVWLDLKGTRQSRTKGASRHRSGAFPLELAWRLIHMFSVEGDLVLDPFVGTGTTTLAAMLSGRSSTGCELDEGIASQLQESVAGLPALAGERLAARLESHRDFVRERYRAKGRFGYPSASYGFPVMTRQEIDICLPRLRAIENEGKFEYRVEYDESDPEDESADWTWFFEEGEAPAPKAEPDVASDEAVQLDFFG